jgi:hypothetical protein
LEEDIQQDLQEGCHAGDCEAKSRTVSQDLENECQDTVEGSGPSEKKDENAHRVRDGDVKAPATLSSSPIQTERRIFIVCILWCIMIWKER